MSDPSDADMAAAAVVLVGLTVLAFAWVVLWIHLLLDAAEIHGPYAGIGVAAVCGAVHVVGGSVVILWRWHR